MEQPVDKTPARATAVESDDSIADAVAAVALVLIFVAACIFWVSGQ